MSEVMYCNCAARHSGVDEEAYRAHGCPKCICIRVFKLFPNVKDKSTGLQLFVLKADHDQAIADKDLKLRKAKVEIEELERRLNQNKCNSGHETLPITLWNCPVCTEERESLLKAKLEKARELFKKRVIEKINTNKKLIPDIKIELLDDALESFDSELNSITLETIKKG